jgi:hypothetical protein
MTVNVDFADKCVGFTNALDFNLDSRLPPRLRPQKRGYAKVAGMTERGGFASLKTVSTMRRSKQKNRRIQ